jgi:Holliday junction resolvase RusA-like endonuclease
MTMLPDMPAVTPPPLTFTVLGTPTAQGSKRAFNNPAGGRPIMREDSFEKTKTWRQDVVVAARNMLQYDAGTEDGKAERIGHPFGLGPVHVTIMFIFARPKHHFRTGRYAHELRPNAPRLHTIKPDGDKLLRSTFDALTTAGMWKDDCQVAGLSAEPLKVYANPGELPGARISIRSYE